MAASERIYSIHRPLAAFCAGAAVASVAGLIGLGGAEFRLPLLIAVFELYPHRAIRINLLISLATLTVSAATRVGVLGTTAISSHAWEVIAMTCGGVMAGWVGAGVVARIPRSRLLAAISILLVAVAVLLVLETLFQGQTFLMLPDDPSIRLPAAFVGGSLVGAVSSLLGVAGGEFIIPLLVFLFGLDIRTAGTASVLISVPIVVAGLTRHWLAGRFRSRSLWAYLVIPMSLGSAVGAIAGGYAAAWVPTEALRIALAVVLAGSAIKLARKVGLKINGYVPPLGG